MKFIQNNWILLVILIAVIFLVYKYWSKVNSEQESKSKINIGNNIVNDFKNAVKSDTGNVTTNITPVNPVKVVNITDYSKWKIGDKIYAGENGVNAYNAPTSGVNSLFKHYNKGQYIGDYLANVNGYAKIVIDYNPNSLALSFGVTNTMIVYCLINQVYSK